MKHIGSLFERYQKLLKPPQSSVEKIVIQVIKEKFNFDIEHNKCSYNLSTKTVYLKIPSILKTEIFFKKQELLQTLKERLGESAPNQIL